MTVFGDPWPMFDIRPPRTSPEQVAWQQPPLSLADIADLINRYAVTGENVVTAEVVTVQDLADLLTDQLRKAWNLAPDRPEGRQELTCAADVAEALAAVTPERPAGVPSSNPFMPAPLGHLIDIPVIVSPDSPPGSWRLVTHGGCKVLGEYPDHKISHEGCEITAEGCLS